jgi:hypothetical protein
MRPQVFREAGGLEQASWLPTHATRSNSVAWGTQIHSSVFIFGPLETGSLAWGVLSNLTILYNLKQYPSHMQRPNRV